jgi:hypothetical protein
MLKQEINDNIINYQSFKNNYTNYHTVCGILPLTENILLTIK